MVKKSGAPRQKRYWSDRLHAVLWYLDVKNETGFSDYRLDALITDRATPGDVKTPARLISRIKGGQLPPRQFGEAEIDVVAEVGSFAPKARQAFEHPVWDILNTPPSLANTEILLDSCLEDLRLQRASWGLAQGKVLDVFGAGVDERSAYNLCLKLALSDIGYHDQVRLVALLVREADLSRSFDIAELAMGHLEEVVDRWLRGRLTAEDAFEDIPLVMDTFCLGGSTIKDAELPLLGRMRARSKLLLLPAGLVLP